MGKFIMENNIGYSLGYVYHLKIIINFLIAVDHENLNEDLISRFADYDEKFLIEAINYAFKCGKIELAKKVQYIKSMRLIKKFEDSILSKTQEQFLSRMSWISKSELKDVIELSATFKNRELTDIEKRMISLLNASIDNELKTLASSTGFDSVEAWKEINARKYANSSEEINDETLDGLVQRKTR